MQQLSGLDASFLYLETQRAPMHIGSLSVLEGSLRFEDFRALLAARIHMVASLRQRLVNVPLGLDRPYWVDDPDFALDRHLSHIALPRPGGWRQLRKITARIFSQPLDHSRPLWEMAFVEGLDTIPQVPPGSTAVISRVHHAAIDGMSGADILGMLFDISPEGREIEPPRTPFAPEPVPGDLEMLQRALKQVVARPLKLPSLLMETVKSAARARAAKKDAPEARPVLPFTAPRTILNKPVSSNRVWNTALLSLDRVKALKRHITGTTVNDVMLAICAGALRRYLLEKDALPDRPLVAMVPVSTRTKQEKNALGNQVSAMFLQIATDVADPILRLKQIHKNARAGKTYQNAVNARKLTELSEFVPFGLAGTAARVYSRSHLADVHRPVANVVITNVPGPQIPLYLAGKRLLAQLGTAPIVDGMGLMIPIFSYNGVISLSPTSSDNIMPDLDKFARYLRLEANTLEAAVLGLPEVQERLAAQAREAAKRPEVRKIFAGMGARLAKDPGLQLPSQDVFQFAVTGDQPQQWVFDLAGDPPRIYEGSSDDAACTLTMADQHFLRMAAGKLDGTAAFMQGKLKVSGDINKAIAFGQVLTAFQAPPRGTPRGGA